jgi:type IV secretory pathway VirB6-like protein
VTVNSKSDPLTIYSGVETDFALPALPLIAGAAIIFPSVIYLLKIFKGTAEGCPAQFRVTGDGKYSRDAMGSQRSAIHIPAEFRHQANSAESWRFFTGLLSL